MHKKINLSKSLFPFSLWKDSDFLMSYALCIMDRFICVACSNIHNTLQYICVTGTNMATRCLHRVRTYIMDQLRVRSICWIHTGSDMRHMMLCKSITKTGFCFISILLFNWLQNVIQCTDPVWIQQFALSHDAIGAYYARTHNGWNVLYQKKYFIYFI